MVLFPHTLLPLHVFEPRYRAMTAWCLGNDHMLAVGRVGSVMGAGRIVRHLELPDGGYHIVVAGEARVALEGELPERDGYRLFRARTLVDEGQVQGQLATIRALCATLALRSEEAATFVQYVLDSGDPSEVADRLAGGIPDVEERQELLACTRVDQRLDRIIQALAGLV